MKPRKPCGYCNKAFAPRNSRQKYCTRRHQVLSRKIPTVKVTCPTCGKERLITWYNYLRKVRRDRFWCSNKCAAVRYYEKWIAFKCELCGALKKMKPGRYILKKKRKEKFFCSQKCSNDYWQKKRHGGPNTLEAAVLKMVKPFGFLYTGDFKLRIGRRNPDFTHKTKPLVIEAFGGYWHPVSDEPHRIRHYKKYGYQCLVIWRQDLLKNPAGVKARIARFAKAA